MPPKTKPEPIVTPIVTLTTDFGLGDHYAGAMKGVILGICPAARIVDITQDCAAYDIDRAAFTIAQVYRYFPPKTAHVVVVDPGVGTSRRPILIEAVGQYFIGPDNGVFSFILSEESCTVRAITNSKYFVHPVSQTFHGRDVFAPVAARLASGVPAAKMGEPVEDFLRPRSSKPDRTARRGWTGRILNIDRFGNVVTNFLAADFSSVLSGPFEMSVGLLEVTQLAANYEQYGFGELFVIVGSSGYFEVSANQASAAKMLGVGTGAPIELRIFGHGTPQPPPLP